MADLYINWDEYHRTIEQLAIRIHQSGWQFNQILCLAKGGLRVGDILSRLFRQPLAILAVSSYGGINNQERGHITIAQDLTMTTVTLGSHVLLVDDLVDSGLSLQQTRHWLEVKYGGVVKDVRTAVLWYKAASCITPDYYVHYLPENPWIHQPFERYEQLSVTDLAATVSHCP